MIKVASSIAGTEHFIEACIAWLGAIRVGVVLVVYTSTVGGVATLCGFGNGLVRIIDGVESLQDSLAARATHLQGVYCVRLAAGRLTFQAPLECTILSRCLRYAHQRPESGHSKRGSGGAISHLFAFASYWLIGYAARFIDIRIRRNSTNGKCTSAYRTRAAFVVLG